MTPSDCKYVAITPPEAIRDNSSWGTTELDTAGFDHCEIIVLLGALDIGITVLKVQESDVSGSGFADVTGLVFGTSNQISGAASVLPSATDDNKIFVFEVNLQGRKRYLDLVATIGDGTTGGFMAAFARLTRGTHGTVTAADRGASQVLRV